MNKGIYNLWKLFLLLTPLFLVGCLYSSEPPAKMANGKTMYNDYCSGCHRASGTGNFFLGVPPVFSSGMKRRELVHLIREGNPDYDRMPVFPQISFTQTHKIVDYLNELESGQPD